MGIAKRLYLYAVSSVSLLVLSVGLYNLAAVVFGSAADALSAGMISRDDNVGREQVSLAIALVAVGLPVFAVHWWLVGRGRRGADDSAHSDRRSAVRAFHMGLVATVSLGVATFAAVQALDSLIGNVVGVETFDGTPVSDYLAMLVVALLVWWYHADQRAHDLRHDRMSGAAAWLTRLHRHGWAFIGLMLVVGGASQVLGTLASVLIGRYELGAEQRWWLEPLVFSTSMILVGLAVFAVHATDARRAMRDAALIGEDDRTSALRPAYFGLVILVAQVDGGLAVAASLSEVGRWALGVGDATDLPAFAELVVGPLVVAIPFVVAGWVHWLAYLGESIERSPTAQLLAERLGLHLLAGTGLAFMAVGSGQLVGRFLEIVFSAAYVDDFFANELMWLVAQVAVGAALWSPAWTVVLRRRSTTQAVERQATTGRAYLFLVVGAALIAAVPSAAFSLYRLIDTSLGGDGLALSSDIAVPIGVVAVASTIATYHARLLVGDLRSAPAVVSREAMSGPAQAVGQATVGTLTGIEAPAPTVEAVGPTVEAVGPTVGTPSGIAAPAPVLACTLRGPAGTDLRSVANAIRDGLPAGVVLEVG